MRSKKNRIFKYKITSHSDYTLSRFLWRWKSYAHSKHSYRNFTRTPILNDWREHKHKHKHEHRLYIYIPIPFIYSFTLVYLFVFFEIKTPSNTLRPPAKNIHTLLRSFLFLSLSLCRSFLSSSIPLLFCFGFTTI